MGDTRLIEGAARIVEWVARHHPEQTISAQAVGHVLGAFLGGLPQHFGADASL